MIREKSQAPKETPEALSPEPELTKDRRVLSVSEVAHDIKLILENTLPEVWVEGEVSNFQAYASGHFYFTLKDSSAVLPAVMFRGANRGIKFQIENGQKLICFGKISIYGASGKYQIIIERVEPKGIGGQQLALEQLKKRLEKEGLFAPEHKKSIPYLPKRIGIVTSIQGAALRDMLKVLDRRFGDIDILINSAQVQGDTAKDQIARSIEELNLYNQGVPAGERIEVMIVGRGGGSIEDLWAFNEEIVARAIYNSKIPVISAVGHERDFTICDLVADLRAATPSAAAELVVPEKEELRGRLNQLSQDIRGAFSDIIQDSASTLDDFRHRLNLGVYNLLKFDLAEFESAKRKLMLSSPILRLKHYKEQFADRLRQIYIQASHMLELKNSEFVTLIEKLNSLSPLNILARGYSITFRTPGQEVIKDAKDLKTGDTLKTRLHRGEIFSKVVKLNKES